MASVMSDSAIDAALEELPDWQRTDNAITRVVESPTFPEAIALLQDVAAAAEAADHHPDMDVRWRKVTYSLSTHSAGGITELDVKFARKIDALVADAAKS
ncbi:4a-hydroxytetrahydrobiopterin dehydratase [Rhodococcus sp. KBS0724]|jgi:4a-hydroxytetrahydrobiopterin dehydratase|uniref:4a-hydroxytetrahydrobiopterin dehydratase n=1 Tax=Rhodococcus sp. KBS0724 TaxID=1179674 RepID=UPI00110DD0D4|nr:4a-hydroxytetrahydrobiopterin dehydratase [Rhodococcus sp. KBS0724]TSD46144.1 4a-hydroxytetrahydrobiopterin dehydratase [Rhodococcus sp. KBS0724]